MATALNKPSIADILRNLLNSRGLSVSELARQIKLPQPTVQRITSGTHHRPHSKTLHALAHYFGITENQLRGIDPIPWLPTSLPLTATVRHVPILNLQQALQWPELPDIPEKSMVIDLKTSEATYATHMPDASMEPLIPKGSLLIVDPKRTPHYRSIVVVKIKNHTDAFIRQLIIDTKNCYIRPLSQDFEQFKMALLEPEDSVLGVVVEVRLHCEDI